MRDFVFFAMAAIASAITVSLYLLSLRRLGTRIINLAALFSGISLLTISPFVNPVAVKAITILLGTFIAVYSAIKVIRKMY
jgi:hypothetical protein